MGKNIENSLISVFKKFVEKNNNVNLDLNTKIDNLGLDSLDLLDLLMQIENKLGVNIPIERFTLCYSIGDVARLIYSLSDDTVS